MTNPTLLLLALLVGAGAVRTAAAEPTFRGLLLDGTVVGSAVVAVGERGTIVRSQDSGKAWTRVSSPVHATLTGVSFADATHGWAVGHDGAILNTSDGGHTWALQFSTGKKETSLLDVLALDRQRVIAVGGFGAFYFTSDGGKTWTAKTILDEELHLNRITRLLDGSVVVAGERGTLVRLTGPHYERSQLSTGYEGSFYGVLSLSPDRALAYGLRGNIFLTADGGQTWSRRETRAASILNTAVRLKSGTIVVAGGARVFLLSRDNGDTFESWKAGLITPVAELLEAPDGTVIALGEAGAHPLEAPLARTPQKSALVRAHERAARRQTLPFLPR